MANHDRQQPASRLPKADADQPDDAAAGSVVHVGDLLDSAAVRLPEDHPDYPLQLRLVLFELFASLKDAEPLRREGNHRAAAIEGLRAVYQFLARFESGKALTASFLSLESALTALEEGVVEPLLRHTRLRGRGSNSTDREVAIGAAVMTVHHLKWAGLSAEEAYQAVARTLQKTGFRAARASRPVEPRTVRYWCAMVAEDVGHRTQVGRFVNDLLLDEHRTAIEATTTQVARKRALTALETILKARCSAVLKKDS